MALRSRWHSNYRYRPKDDSAEESLLDSLDITAALRILEHAGQPNPLHLRGEPKEKLQALIDALCTLSIHDGLTGLVNATFFQAALTSELDRSSRTGRPCGLLLIDLDHFKSVNDNHGHALGDVVLQAVARKMKSSLRNMDTAARVGGEEFAVILPECTPEGAIRAARRIHGALNPLLVDTGNEIIRITSSAGLVWTASEKTTDMDSLLAKADEEMYRAKRSGRHQLCHPSLSSAIVSTEERAVLTLSRLEEDFHGN